MELHDCTLAHGDNHRGLCAWCGRALSPGKRRWCSPGCSAAFAANHYWPQAREAARRRDHHRCRVCGDPFGVQVHHVEPVDHYGAGCKHHLAGLVTLCPEHHDAAHAELDARPGAVKQLRLRVA